ncbi:hypothetical protein GCM10023196_036380 [Actinoallomurus vinaceus]|uniref:Uncharacterized protein n=1 Tax=Actinoallomurus vinaceus TaxID=1080074 RepID=A0ABP8U993_9ACTN
MTKDHQPFVLVHHRPGRAGATARHATLDEAEDLAAEVTREGGDARLYWERPSGRGDLLGTYGPAITHTVIVNGERWSCPCGRRGARTADEASPGESHLRRFDPTGTNA